MLAETPNFDGGFGFLALNNLWWKNILTKSVVNFLVLSTSHSRKVFSRLYNRARIDGIMQPHHNKGRRICRPVRDVKSAGVIAFALVAPRSSLKGGETDVSKKHFAEFFGSTNVIHTEHKFTKLQLRTIIIKQDYNLVTGLKVRFIIFIKIHPTQMNMFLKVIMRSAIGIFVTILIQTLTGWEKLITNTNGKSESGKLLNLYLLQNFLELFVSQENYILHSTTRSKLNI